MNNMSPVQKTAFEAASRKTHSVSKGYLNDPFIHLFAADRTTVNSPLMNRGYWLRTKAFENVLVQFANSLPSSSGGCAPFQVINIGCGFDTLFFRWATDPKLEPTVPNTVGALNITKFLELDVAEMVTAKRNIIQQNAGTLQALTKDEERGKGVYFLESCDLARRADVDAALAKAKIDPALPTLVIAECVLVYMSAVDSDAFLSGLIRDFFGCDGNGAGNQHVLLANYDMIGPEDRFGKMMLENLRRIGLDISSINTLKSLRDHEARCARVGFARSRAVTMKSLYVTVGRDTQIKLNAKELIDDWDEWGIVHEHYAFVMAATGAAAAAAAAAPSSTEEEGQAKVADYMAPPFPRPLSQPLFGSAIV